MKQLRVELPKKLAWVFAGEARYRGAYGGRGSAKSRSFATMCVLRSLERPIRILCAREIQNSIRESVHAQLVERIESMGLEDRFDIGRDYLRGLNGTEFVFRGLHRNVREIKSLEGIDLCWIEEAEAVSEESWTVLIPTIRKPGSEIWLTWNPETADAATHRRFVQKPPPGARIVKVTYRDNPWFPPELEAERQRDLALDVDLHAHVWEGEFRSRSEAQVLASKVRVADFVPQAGWDGPYHGLDFGFAQDPTAGIRCWIADRRLWIEHEAVSVGLELDATAAFLAEHIPGIEDHVIRADSARPESISYLKRHGLPRVVAARKGPRSVEEGIAFLRSFDEIVVHPRCRETTREARLYSYKVDRVTGDVLPTLIDAHNHCIDAVRYAVEPAKRAQAQPRIRAL